MEIIIGNDFNNECLNCFCYECRRNGNDCDNCEKCSGDNAEKTSNGQNDKWMLECKKFK